MASLNRVTGKVFAGEADLENIGIFGSANAGTPTNNTDVATIQSLQAYLAGWTDAVVTSKNFPPIEEVNGALKTISYQACYCLQEGVAEYDSATEYKAGSFCKVNNQIYISLTNSNIGNSVSNTTYWQPAFLRLSGGTMTGNLRIDNNNTPPSLYLRNTAEIAGTTPSSQLNKQVLFQDNNGTTVGYVANQYNTNGGRVTTLNCRNANATANSSIAIGYDGNGNLYTIAPTPALSSNGTNIATTAFVKQYVQCGTVNIDGNSYRDVVYPIAFPDEYVAIAFGRVSDPAQTTGVTYPMIRAIYKTQFRVYNPYSGNVTYTWVAVWRG